MQREKVINSNCRKMEKAWQKGYDIWVRIDDKAFYLSGTERWNVFLYEGILGVMVDRVAMKVHGAVMEYWPVLFSWSWERKWGEMRIRIIN